MSARALYALRSIRLPPTTTNPLWSSWREKNWEPSHAPALPRKTTKAIIWKAPTSTAHPLFSKARSRPPSTMSRCSNEKVRLSRANTIWLHAGRDRDGVAHHHAVAGRPGAYDFQPDGAATHQRDAQTDERDQGCADRFCP